MSNELENRGLKSSASVNKRPNENNHSILKVMSSSFNPKTKTVSGEHTLSYGEERAITATNTSNRNKLNKSK